ncbi:MAG: hypothetical protein V1674_02830 [Candidatus Omnitrophota bacterium]
MKRIEQRDEDRYEIVIKKVGRDEPLEANIMGDRETQEVLRVIGILNLRSAWAS